MNTLIVHEDVGLTNLISEFIKKEGSRVVCTTNAMQAIKSLKKNHFKFCILHTVLPDLDGIVLLKRIKELCPEILVLVISDHGGIDNALGAVRHGASYFIAKPDNNKHILKILKETWENINGCVTTHQCASRDRKQISLDGIVGNSDVMKGLFDIIEKVSDTEATVLILGESGTGKELVARALHNNSSRSSKLFVPINCGAIPEDLLESELFGHVKGSFTGAIGNREGRFSVAQGGTIFLDEIGDLPLRLQVKLLRVLQEKRFEPVGSTKTIHADVRVIAATNVDLEKQVKQKKFREDLFYRLNVLPVIVPPLRERLNDLPLLIKKFEDKNRRYQRQNIKNIAQDVLDVFNQYSWPGNVRELENLMERLSILKAGSEVKLKDLPRKFLKKQLPEIINPIPSLGMAGSHLDNSIDFYKEVESFENQMILRALEHTKWNKNQAAKILNLKRTTLVEKMKKRSLVQDHTRL